MATDNQITFKYKFPETYNPVYINGAHGGINVQGEIIANFYMERTPLPNKVTNNLNTDGSLSDVVSILPEDTSHSYVRYVQTGVVMNLVTAKQLRDWLNKQIEILEGGNK